MNFEQITYKGTVYEITEMGLVSEFYRRRNEKGNKFNLDTQPAEDQVTRCVEWLQLFATPRKTVNYKIGSYGLKHVVERWAGTYITNGAFLLAAHRAGYKIIPDEPLSPNAHFCMSFARGSIGD